MRRSMVKTPFCRRFSFHNLPEVPDTSLFSSQVPNAIVDMDFEP